MRSGYAAIDELAGGELFGDYARAFPESSRDAGRMLRVAVQTDQVDRYQALLELALIDRRPVGDAQWHGLCAAVSWPRPLPEWDRAPIEQWRLDMNPDATPDWPEAYIGGCQIGHRHPNPWLERRPGLLGWLFHDSPPGKSVPARRASLKVLAIAICSALLGLALPGSDTLDYWVGMAAFLIALLTAATL